MGLDTLSFWCDKKIFGLQELSDTRLPHPFDINKTERPSKHNAIFRQSVRLMYYVLYYQPEPLTILPPVRTLSAGFSAGFRGWRASAQGRKSQQIM